MRRKSAVALLLALTVILAVVPGIGSTTTATEEAPADVPEATTAFVDIAVQGFEWVVQRRSKFKNVQPISGGMKTKAKAATQEWVHISIPYPTYLDGTAMKLKRVEFCAAATNPTQTRPIRMDVWADNSRILSENITWSNSTGEVCKTINLATKTWYESVGISVLINYANASDKVTLYKAWIRLFP